MYTIKRLCFDSNLNVPPYEDNPRAKFFSFDAAWECAVKLAEEEVDGLNEDCVEGVSFGIPHDLEFETKQMCRVEYYYNPEGDYTGNTEIVTKYWVEEC